MACVNSDGSFSDDIPAIFSKRDLASYLRCSTKTIDRWEKAGELPRASRIGTCKCKRWRRVDVDAWLADCRTMPIPTLSTVKRRS